MLIKLFVFVVFSVNLFAENLSTGISYLALLERLLLRNPHKLPLAPCSKLLHLSVSVSKLTSPA